MIGVKSIKKSIKRLLRDNSGPQGHLDIDKFARNEEYVECCILMNPPLHILLKKKVEYQWLVITMTIIL